MDNKTTIYLYENCKRCKSYKKSKCEGFYVCDCKEYNEDITKLTEDKEFYMEINDNDDNLNKIIKEIDQEINDLVCFHCQNTKLAPKYGYIKCVICNKNKIHCYPCEGIKNGSKCKNYACYNCAGEDYIICRQKGCHLRGIIDPLSNDTNLN